MEKVKKENKGGVFAIYILCLVLLAVVTSLIGLMLIEKDVNAVTNYRAVLTLSLCTFVCFLVVFLYTKFVLDSKEEICIPLYKACIIIFSVSIITILASAAIFSNFVPYAMPVAFVSLTVTVMLRQRIGMVATLMTAMDMTFLVGASPQHFDFQSVYGILLSAVAGLFMVFLLSKGYTRFKVTVGTAVVALIALPIVMLITMIEPNITWGIAFKRALGNLIGNMGAIAAFTVLLPLYEVIFRVWTDFKLAELCSFNTPLLKELREKAPGTFNHSVLVANLAENCAYAIKANPFMARACGLYHDIGKTKHPEFFVENLKPGERNPHDELIPEVSASMITSHVSYGKEILKNNRLPDEVIKAAAEHHGDTPVMYFYLKAKTVTEGDLDIDQYRYDGPMPTTKYSAIVMICDVCEAMLRTKTYETTEELDDLIGGIIKDKLFDGQFDNCGLTIEDLVSIKKTLVEVYPAMIHKRIDYEKAKERR